MYKTIISFHIIRGGKLTKLKPIGKYKRIGRQGFERKITGTNEVSLNCSWLQRQGKVSKKPHENEITMI